MFPRIRIATPTILRYTLILVLSVAFAFTVKTIWANWTAPREVPPNCTTDPTSPLYHPGCLAPINVSGNLQTKGSSTTATTPYLFRLLNNADDFLRFERNLATNPTTFRLGTDSALVINNSNIDTMTLKGGNVGIGTVPGTKLDVKDGIIRVQNSAFSLYDTTDAKTWNLAYDNGGDYLYLDEVGLGRRFVIKNGGNVGIGTTNPPSHAALTIGKTGTGDGTSFNGVYSNIQSTGPHTYLTAFNAALRANGGISVTNAYGLYVTAPVLTGGAAITNKYAIVTESGAGNVGIGVTSPDPAAKLEVAGQIKITGGSPGPNKVLTSDAGGLASWAAGGGIGGSGTATQVAFFTAGTTIGSDSGLYWDNTNKRLGIGTTTPGLGGGGAKLDVAGGKIRVQNSTFSLYNTTSDKTWDFGNDGDSLYINEVGAGRRFTIRNGGNVGIGNFTKLSPPDYKLHVQGGVADNYIAQIENSDIVNGGGLRIFIANSDPAGEAFDVYTREGLTYKHRFIIRNDGKVGINLDNPGYTLDIGGALRLQPLTSAPTGANGAMYYDSNVGVNKFRCFQNGAWSDCVGGAGGLTNAFTQVRNSGDVTQFTASGADYLQFVAGTGLSVAFDSVNRRTTFTNTGDTNAADDITTITGTAPISVTGAGNTRNVALAGGCSSSQILKWNGAAWSCAADDAGEAGFWAASGNNIYNTNTGNVGIGTTTSPRQRLDVNGTIVTDAGHLVAGNTSGHLVLNAGLSGNIWFRKAGSVAGDGAVSPYTDLMIITNAGNVGIGATDPGAKLDVNGEVRSRTGILQSLNPNNNSAGVTLSWLSDVARIRIGGNGAGAANGLDIQKVGNVSLMRILDNGNVGIGVDPAQKLHVAGNLRVDGAIVAPEGTLRDDGGGWVRTYGNTGWYNQSYGGGWYMTDIYGAGSTDWVRSYNNKNVYTGGIIRGDTDLRVGNDSVCRRGNPGACPVCVP